MDTIVTMAIVGTGQQSEQPIATGTPVDALIEQLSVESKERQLLLAAGALTVYCQAGCVMTGQLPSLPEPANPEQLAACSAGAAQLVENFLKGEHIELFPAALERLKHAQLRLPHTLLPQALAYGTRSRELRSALVPVLGERGHWLSQFHSGWHWVTEKLSEHEITSSPDVSEELWQEGTSEQRQEVLRHVRRIDPARARELLGAVWKQEKAEVRSALLATFEEGFSAEDEPFLEKALDDRAESVRSLAASLLARIPTSALMQRMLIRADALLDYSNRKLTVTLPSSIDKVWQRDGIVAKPAYGMGERAWWLQQVLSIIPPSHWEERFALAPAALLKAIKANEWHEAVIGGWLNATKLHHDEKWAVALWEWDSNTRNTVGDIPGTLINVLPPQEVEEKVLQAAAGKQQRTDLLQLLPVPWNEDFARKCIRITQEQLGKNTKHSSTDEWVSVILHMASAVPDSCIDAVLGPWELPDGNTWQKQYWQEQLDTALEQLHIRKRIIEEIK